MTNIETANRKSKEKDNTKYADMLDVLNNNNHIRDLTSMFQNNNSIEQDEVAPIDKNIIHRSYNNTIESPTQDMYHWISTQKSSMMQFGAKERLIGDKSLMAEF